VRTLKGLRESTAEEGVPLAAQLFGEIADPEVLLWAALFHDVGKGVPGQDHAQQGAETVRRVFTRMGFPVARIETISFLVREHLSMVKTATQRDIQEEKVVVQFARKFRDVDELNMLYLLTVADCMATGPKAWNAWKDVLVRELFFKARHILERGELATRASAETVANKKEEVFLKAHSMPREKLDALFENMSTRYLLHTPARDILRHMELFHMLGESPFVLDPCARTEDYHRSLTVCSRDRPGLFSCISGVLTLNNLDILNADIYTWGNGIALDVFTVRAPRDSLREDEAWRKVSNDLQGVLSGAIELESALKEKLLAQRPAHRPGAQRPDRIVVDNESSDFFTVIEVTTHDFAGLLYRVTDALFRCGLDVRIAKIATHVDQVVDVFYVCDREGQKVDDDERVSRVRDAIGRVLREAQHPP
jgi:[protein-PII] uridylyltransferase